MAWLVAVDGDLRGRRYPLLAPCLVGRGPYNHVVLDDTRISRQHAKISPEAAGHVLIDLNSANGTYVNESQIKRHTLQPGDVVRFGPFRFRFDLESTEERLVPRKGEEKFVEVLTYVGSGHPPAAILDSLDAKLITDNGLGGGGLQRLEDADRKLRTLYGFLQAIATTLDTTALLDRILANVLEIYPSADLAVVYLPDPDNGQMEPAKTLGRSGEPAAETPTLPPQFHDAVVEQGKATISAPRATPGRKGMRQAKGALSMHAPMIFGGAVLGVLHVRGLEQEGGEFDQADLDLLTGLAAQAAMSLKNARMHQESLKQQRLQQDLLLAEQIQKSFLPRVLPSVDGIEFVTEYRPAYQVGGDFYDVFWLSGERIGMFIGDVSGKGVSAALLMARVSSDLRVAATAEAAPARALAQVNRLLVERGQTETFVTGVYLTLDVRTHRLTLANAGHLPPFIRRRPAGALERIDAGAGTALGFFDDTVFEQVDLALETGDALVLCTDGVIEAASPAGELYGFDRLQRVLAAGSSRAGELAARLQRDLRTHVGQAAQNDDLTLIVCGVTEIITPRKPRRNDETTEVSVVRG